MESAAGLAGSAEIFLRPGDATYGTAFQHHLRLTVQGHHDVRLGENVVLESHRIPMRANLRPHTAVLADLDHDPG